jgi:predicted transcriptional regulator
VANEIKRLLRNITTLNRLGDNVEWIRLDQFDFELHCLEDAHIIMPSWDDFAAQTRALTDIVNNSSRLRGIGTGLDREFMRAVADAGTTGDLTVELIFAPKVIDAICSDPELSDRFRTLAAAPNASIYRYEGDDTLMEMGIHDTHGPEPDSVMLCGDYEDGAPPGTVESTHKTVREWAESCFADRRAESTNLKPTVFTP